MTTLVYLINVDWFFVSHFRHLAKEAIANGYRVILATRVTGYGDALSGDGIELVPLPHARTGMRPLGLRSSVNIVEALLRQHPRAVLHGFGVFGVLIGALATRNLPTVRCVYTITGRGYAAISRAPSMLLLGKGTSTFNRLVADDDNTRWMVENDADIQHAGLRKAFRQGRVAVVGGAGVDPSVFVPTSMAKHPPLRLGFVARLIWSKGLDIAVKAVSSARARGYDVRLTVAGEPDHGNPGAFSEAQLAAFAATPGVKFVGRIGDIPGFWNEHHVAFLPSRGGEGMPRSLLEAAACGRPILTSDVPGCRELATQTRGWVAPTSASAANTIADISQCPDLEARGLFARSVIEKEFTQERLWQRAVEWYARAA